MKATHNKIKSLYKCLSFKQKIVSLTVLIIVFLVVLLSSLNYSWHSKNFVEQTIQQNQQILEQTGMNIDTYFEELCRLTLTPYYNDDVMTLLEDTSNETIKLLEKKRSIENFLSSVMILPRSEILRVYILTEYDIYSYTRTPYDMEQYSTYKETDWYQDALSNSKSILLPVYSEKVFGDKKTVLFSVVHRLRSKEDNSKVLGVIKVDADYSAVKSICDKVNFKGNGSLFLIKDDKDIIYKNDILELESFIPHINLGNSNSRSFVTEIDNEKITVNITPLKFSDMKLVAINSFDSLQKDSRHIRNITIFIAFLCLLLSIGLLVFIISNSFRPLENVVASMEEVQGGNLDVHIPLVNHDEIGYLTNSFNAMIKNIKHMMDSNTKLVKEVYETRYLQKEAQYNALCNQIKPHFLYNTLNTISILVKCNRNLEAVQSIENFSYFLRGIMNVHKTIPLQKELTIVGTYLSLQKQKYGDNLQYELNVDENFSSLLIPALLLQPIVENSIIHGCENKRGTNHILINGKEEGNYFIISIEDDGCGIPPEQLEEINLQLQNKNITAQNSDNDLSLGIGLTNIAKRLFLKFGSDSSIKIESVVGSKTIVTLSIPLDNCEKEHTYVSNSDC